VGSLLRLVRELHLFVRGDNWPGPEKADMSGREIRKNKYFIANFGVLLCAIIISQKRSSKVTKKDKDAGPGRFNGLFGPGLPIHCCCIQRSIEGVDVPHEFA
jgi:hypothetical protein